MNKEMIFRVLFIRIFGVIVLAIGAVNMFWENDPGYGVLILVISAVYFRPLSSKRIGFKAYMAIQILLGLFILWTALGVAQLSDKIKTIMNDY